MPNPSPLADLNAPPVNPNPSQLMPVCGHPQSAVAHPGDERIRTRYCTMCAAGKPMIKRTKALTTILLQVGLYFDPDKAQVIEDHISLLERRIKHLEQTNSEWQEKTGEKHPTLTGF